MNVLRQLTMLKLRNPSPQLSVGPISELVLCLTKEKEREKEKKKKNTANITLLFFIIIIEEKKGRKV